MSIAQALCQLSHDEVIVAGFPDRLDDSFPQAEDGSVDHIGVILKHGGGWEYNVGIGGISRELAVNTDQKVQFGKGLAPDRGLWPGGEYRSTMDDQASDSIWFTFEH